VGGESDDRPVESPSQAAVSAQEQRPVFGQETVSV
jgi:hypothetical protein